MSRCGCQIINCDLHRSAPEMFEALRCLLHEDGPNRHDWEMAKAAYAKAAGNGCSCPHQKGTRLFHQRTCPEFEK